MLNTLSGGDPFESTLPPAEDDVHERHAIEVQAPINLQGLILTINLDAPQKPLVAASHDVPALHKLIITNIEDNMQIHPGLGLL